MSALKIGDLREFVDSSSEDNSDDEHEDKSSEELEIKKEEEIEQGFFSGFKVV